MYTLKYIHFLLFVVLLFGCSDEIETHFSTQLKKYHSNDNVIFINTSRNPFNLLNKDSMLFKSACGIKRHTRSGDDYFSIEKDVSIIRKTKRKHLFKRSDKTRKTNCTPEKSPCFNYNLTNEH